MKDKKDQKKIDSKSTLSEIAEQHPNVADYLVNNYGFHCMSCFLSDFESFEDGASVHGIMGEDYDKLLDEINEMVKDKKD